MACSDVQSYRKRDVLGYYKLLNVSPDASAADIRRSFYAFAKVYHPDKNTSPEAEAVFKGVLQAYEVLGDPEKREQYDGLTSREYFTDNLGGPNLPSFFLGALLGNVFIYGASVGIIVCPLWGWILAPTLLCVVVAPTLFAKRYVKLAALCYGVAVAPIVIAEIGIQISCSILTGVAGVIINSLCAKESHQLEDIEEGWVNVEVEA